MDTLEFSYKIAELMLGKKGYNIKFLDLQKLSTIGDYFVICSADSDVQVKAIADEVDKKLSKMGIKCYHREGYESLNWVILDYFDVVVHIFKNTAREYYGLERLWGDAKVIEVDDDFKFPPEVDKTT